MQGVFEVDDGYIPVDIGGSIKATDIEGIHFATKKVGSSAAMVSPELTSGACPARRKNFRRLSKDHEYSTASSKAFIYIAMIRIMVRRLAGVRLFKHLLIN
jgi:hypothetical protein